MIEVHDLFIDTRHILQTTIVGVVWQVGDMLLAQSFQDRIRDSGFAGAGAARHADCHATCLRPACRGRVICQNSPPPIKQKPHADYSVGSYLSHLWDLNPKPLAYEANALPLS